MYRAGQVLSMDEDHHVEFKMHWRNALTEIPGRCQTMHKGRIVRTMQPNSKTFSAYLNTDGGRIFIGIDNDGVVVGVRMTRSMVDHFYLSLDEVLKQFTPAVPPELVRVRFVPVEENEDEDEKKKYIIGSDDSDSDDDFFSAPTKKSTLVADEYFVKDHMIGGSRCFCDQSTFGAKSDLYVIIIQVKKDPRGIIYQNEEGLAYRRKNGSNRMYSIADMEIFINTEKISPSSKEAKHSSLMEWMRKAMSPLKNMLEA